MTISQLDSFFLRAADILRRKMDASEFKEFIFGMLSLKRLSDEFVIERHQDWMLYATQLSDRRLLGSREAMTA